MTVFSIRKSEFRQRHPAAFRANDRNPTARVLIFTRLRLFDTMNAIRWNIP
jgi:hypothetical protein